MHRITADNAEKIWAWFQERGGIAIWKSLSLSDPSASWTSPLKGPDGEAPTKPHWSAENEPSEIITDPTQVLVNIPKQVKRFRVGLRLGAQGMMVKCTDAASRRIRKECEKAGPNSWYEFDEREAVIFVPDKTIPLPEFIQSQQGV